MMTVRAGPSYTPGCHKAEMGSHVLLRSPCSVVNVNTRDGGTVSRETALMVVYDRQMLSY